jgi:hypothetical protein
MLKLFPSASVLVVFIMLTNEDTAPFYDAAHAHDWKPPAGFVAAWSFYPTLAKEMRELCGRDDKFYDDAK